MSVGEATERRLLTAEELWELPERPGVRLELVRGEVVEVAESGARHGLIVGVVYDELKAFARAHRLGVVCGDGVGFVLGRDPDIVRIPDVSFVARARVPGGGVPEGYWPVPPDLAVEVVSPRDNAEEVHEKVRDYLDAGVLLVLVLWPRSRSVTVYGSEDARELAADDELDLGAVLPGFRVRVGRLFEIEDPHGVRGA